MLERLWDFFKVKGVGFVENLFVVAKFFKKP